MNLVNLVMKAAIGNEMFNKSGCDTEAFQFIAQKIGQIKIVDLNDDEVAMIVRIREEANRD